MESSSSCGIKPPPTASLSSYETERSLRGLDGGSPRWLGEEGKAPMPGGAAVAPPSKPFDSRICRCWRRYVLPLPPAAPTPPSPRGTERLRPPGLEGMLRFPPDRTRRCARFSASERRLFPALALAVEAPLPAENMPTPAVVFDLRPPGDKGGMCKPACALLWALPARLPPGETGGRR